MDASRHIFNARHHLMAEMRADRGPPCRATAGIRVEEVHFTARLKQFRGIYVQEPSSAQHAYTQVHGHLSSHEIACVPDVRLPPLRTPAVPLLYSGAHRGEDPRW